MNSNPKSDGVDKGIKEFQTSPESEKGTKDGKAVGFQRSCEEDGYFNSEFFIP